MLKRARLEEKKINLAYLMEHRDSMTLEKSILDCSSDEISKDLWNVFETDTALSIKAAVLKALDRAGCVSTSDIANLFSVASLNPDLILPILFFLRNNKESLQSFPLSQVHLISYIAHNDPIVRSVCIELACSFDSASYSNEEIQRIIRLHMQDPHFRVREASYSAMLRIMGQGKSIDVAVYQSCLLGISDDFWRVREKALTLAFKLAQQNLEVAFDNDFCVKDHSFLAICEMATDSEIRLRELAFQYLGQYENVNPEILLKTLFKQTLVHKDSSTETEAISPAFGTFVQGLEDEFYKVRLAAIHAMTNLSLYNREFALLSLDFLVDMFNDDIFEVRVVGVESATKIATIYEIQLNLDDLETILGNLEDADLGIRTKTRKLLRHVKLACTDGMKLLINTMKQEIKAYSMDIVSIFECVSAVAKNHSEMICELFDVLFVFDRRYLISVPSLKNNYYICLVIAATSAAEVSPEILEKFPAFLHEHCEFVRLKYPSLFKTLTIESPKGIICRFVEQYNLFRTDYSLLKELARTAGYISRCDADLGEFLFQFLRCLKLCIKARCALTKNQKIEYGGEIVQSGFALMYRFGQPSMSIFCNLGSKIKTDQCFDTWIPELPEFGEIRKTKVMIELVEKMIKTSFLPSIFKLKVDFTSVEIEDLAFVFTINGLGNIFFYPETRSDEYKYEIVLPNVDFLEIKFQVARRMTERSEYFLSDKEYSYFPLQHLRINTKEF